MFQELEAEGERGVYLSMGVYLNEYSKHIMAIQVMRDSSSDWIRDLVGLVSSRPALVYGIIW